ncbi:MAG: class II aldolase/adducin family protein [Desulfamplus sp.]|nr:class II aldolase/adducin family protein [Desulfamplus sp.]
MEKEYLNQEREQIIDFGLKMLSAGLTTGSGGNLSCFNRDLGLIAITPSGVEYPDLTPDGIIVMTPDGALCQGEGTPSSETGFHLALYHARPDVNAVVHTHSPYATTFACLGREIPPVHYLVACAGKKVSVAPYAIFGSMELAESIVSTLGDDNAVLMANHGLVAVGETLSRAFDTAGEIELVARIYYQSLCIGTPVTLSDHQMDNVMEKFKTYRLPQ